MGTSAEFWRDQASWPKDFGGYVFLGRAVHQLGANLFGGKWSGKECCAEAVCVNSSADDRTINNLIARWLPQLKRREYLFSMAPPPISPIGASRTFDARPVFDIRPEERAALRSFLIEHNAEIAEQRARFDAVQAAIAELAVDGRLATAYRALAGGEFHPAPSTWWNTERIPQRFAFCRINPSNPFEPNGAAWIFVSSSDLSATIKSPGGRPPEYNWDGAYREFLSIIAKRGKPARANKRLPTQSQLIDEIVDYFAKMDIDPSRDTVKKKVSEWLKEIG